MGMNGGLEMRVGDGDGSAEAACALHGETPSRNRQVEPQDRQDPANNAVAAGHRDLETPASRFPWKKVAFVIGGAVVTIGGTVVATLAATHKTAVSENAAAYVNGINDALAAVRNGFDPSE